MLSLNGIFQFCLYFKLFHYNNIHDIFVIIPIWIKTMKKLTLLLTFSLLISSAQADNWKKISKNEYVNLDSIQRYEDETTQNREAYSFWIKGYNDKSRFYTELEKQYNKKIRIVLSKDIIDCKNKAFAFKAYIIYGSFNRIIDAQQAPNGITWNSVVPNSYGERSCYGICAR